MADVPGTRPSLLIRLRDASDADAWQQFTDLYSLLITRFARKRGLQDADAADLTQLVLQAVSGAIPRLEYDSGKGTFRSWLYTIVRRQLGRFLAREQQAVQGSGDTNVLDRLEQEPDPADADADLWEQQYQRQRFLWAAGRVRGEFKERTWQAFWQTAVDGQEIAAVAAALDLTVGAVYTARTRVLNRIRQEARPLEE